MNYKTSFIIISINYFVVLNAWANCCFVDSSGGSLSPCVELYSSDLCQNEKNGIAFITGFTHCFEDGITCCAGPNSWPEFINKGSIIIVDKDICNHPDVRAAVRLKLPKLGVTLNKLTTSILENQLVIQWDTASEENNLGMNFWCAQMSGNQFQKITQLNSQLIPSKAILPNYGAPYSSTDYPYINTNLKPGVQHCALEDIDASGQCTLHCDQLDTIVVGKGQSAPNVNLNELNAKAIALCQQYKDKLAETGQEGICLDQLLMSH